MEQKGEGQLMELQQDQQRVAVIGTALIPGNMTQAVELAKMMAAGKLVPQHLQDSPADCLMIIEQAVRWRMSPFAVAQCASSVKGKLMFEGKLVAAAVHTSGLLQGRLRPTYKGEGNMRTVTITGLIRGETEPSTVDVVIKDVATENGCWKKQPDQQLFYAGVRVWARRHMPEVMLGVYSPEENFEDEFQPDASAKPAASLVAEPRRRSESQPAQQAAPQVEERQPPAHGPEPENDPPPPTQPAPAAEKTGDKTKASPGAINMIRSKIKAMNLDEKAILTALKLERLEGITFDQVNEVLNEIKRLTSGK